MIDLQPSIENEFIRIQPLDKQDFDVLYKIASDPLLWEQHPNKDRYKKEVFERFFEDAIQSKGAFLVFDNKSPKGVPVSTNSKASFGNIKDVNTSQQATRYSDTNKTGAVIGSSRFYDFNKDEKSIIIGFTFISRSHWGTNYNRALKSLMINYAFHFVDKVIFHIGIDNIRSQKATEKLGAIKIGQMERRFYVGSEKKLNFVYELDKGLWLTNEKNSSIRA